MNIQRFHAPTSREALAKARMAFGEGTLILSNRPTANGVEVVATAEDTLEALNQGAQGTPASTASTPAATPASAAKARAATPSTQAQVEADADQLTMSTLSFQDYVRERMLRRHHETTKEQSKALTQFMAPRLTDVVAPAPAAPVASAAAPAPAAKPARSTPSTTQGTPQSIVDELHAMRELIEDRFNTLSWLGQARQHPIHANLLLKMIRAGYSPTLARTILEKMPEDSSATESMRWIMDVLARNLKTDLHDRPLHVEGGVHALVGATGVGKTTSAAKLAGQCARTYGPNSVGLITLDTYRVGAHEQLRTYGRMMGVVAHLAHDRAALQDLLNLLAGKKMVLIDTSGLAPRDPRKSELLDVLDIPNVQRLLVLNAGNHGDSLDESVLAFRSPGLQNTLISKIDEAVKLGPALDAAIRNQLVLRGITTGQKVPDDWEQADAEKLVRLSMRAPVKSAFDPQTADLSFFFNQTSSRASQGHFHA